MNEDYLTKAEVIVLVDERIKKHDDDVNKPQHLENQTVLRALTLQVNGLDKLLTRMEAQQSIVMKFAGAGIVIWSIRQIVDLIHTFH